MVRVFMGLIEKSSGRMLTLVDILSNFASDMQRKQKKEKFKIYEIIVVFLPYIPSLHPNLAKYGILLSPENRSFPQMFFSACF